MTIQLNFPLKNRSSRVTSKITSKIDSFNQKRDEALSEFLEKIESIIEKVEPDYLISIKEEDAEIDKFLLYFSKIWNQHVSSEYHGTSIEEAINNPRFVLSLININTI